MPPPPPSILCPSLEKRCVELFCTLRGGVRGVFSGAPVPWSTGPATEYSSSIYLYMSHDSSNVRLGKVSPPSLQQCPSAAAAAPPARVLFKPFALDCWPQQQLDCRACTWHRLITRDRVAARYQGGDGRLRGEMAETRASICAKTAWTEEGA